MRFKRTAGGLAVVVVGELDAPLPAVEEGRRDGQIAFPGKPVGDLADMAVDAENFLDDDDAALGAAFGVAFRPSAVGVEFMAVGRRQSDGLAHSALPVCSVKRSAKGPVGQRGTKGDGGVGAAEGVVGRTTRHFFSFFLK